MAQSSIKLGVNIDHIATLRQVRGGSTKYPDLHKFALLALKAGATQITIHLREDQRHIQLEDLITLSKDDRIPLNLEMAMTKKMFSLAKKYKPEWICLVPEKRAELTTEGGLNLKLVDDKTAKKLRHLQSLGIEISAFIDPDPKQVVLANELLFDAVEFHTGHWVLAQGGKRKAIWQKLIESAELAHRLGLKVHAGHGLDFESCEEITQLPHLKEVNIGHSIVCHSIEFGLEKTIQMMKRRLSE